MWQGKQNSLGGEPDTGLHTQLRKGSLKVMQATKMNCKVGLLLLSGRPPEESKLKKLSWIYLVANLKC